VIEGPNPFPADRSGTAPNDPDENVRNCLSRAAKLDLPFAVWRRPGKSSFEGVISCGPLTRRPVFTVEASPAFFALSRFLTDHPNQADAISADCVIKNEAILFLDGAVQRPEPSTPLQQELARAASDPAVLPGIRADAGAPAPSRTPQADYMRLVSKAIQAIADGRLTKVVTSRAEARPLAADYDLLALFEALAAKLPTAFVALAYLPGQGAWLVGTPETLLSHRGGVVKTIALAGTQWLGDEVALDAVEWPQKIIDEQALVGDYIRTALHAEGLAGFDERGPRTVRAASLVHLQSDFAARIARDGAPILAGLLNRLHPTSAVCGMPRAAALQFLHDNEGYDRDCYTGYLGPVNFDGATELYVNLRTARILGDTAFLYVGGGIVAGSDPQTEWEETVQKSRTVGSILDSPHPRSVDSGRPL
jgi:isochorismate synthase